MTETDGPQGHPDRPDPLAELEARAQHQVDTLARSLAEARDDLNAIRDLRDTPASKAEERRRRKAAWKANGARLGLIALIGAGVSAALRLIAGRPVAAASVIAGTALVVVVLAPNLLDRDRERDKAPRQTVTPTAIAPSAPSSPQTTATASPSPSPSPSSPAPTPSPSPATGAPDEPHTMPPTQPDGTATPSSPPTAGPTMPPGDTGGPPPGEPETAGICVIGLRIPIPLIDVRVLCP